MATTRTMGYNTPYIQLADLNEPLQNLGQYRGMTLVRIRRSTVERVREQSRKYLVEILEYDPRTDYCTVFLEQLQEALKIIRYSNRTYQSMAYYSTPSEIPRPLDERMITDAIRTIKNGDVLRWKSEYDMRVMGNWGDSISYAQQAQAEKIKKKEEEAKKKAEEERMRIEKEKKHISNIRRLYWARNLDEQKQRS